MRCDGRVAFVTGGASGIGEAVSQILAEAGARVAICDIQDDRAFRLADDIGNGAAGFRLDVTDIISVAQTAARVEQSMGPIDILVNVAGGSAPRPFVENDEAYMRDTIELNLFGVLRCTRAILPGMIERRYGRIIHMSSGAGLHGLPENVPYAAAKGGVNAFTKTIATEVAEFGITSNAILPGPTLTPSVLAYCNSSKEADEQTQAMVKRIPMGRFGTPQDMALPVRYFASDSAGYVTGQLISINGAMHL